MTPHGLAKGGFDTYKHSSRHPRQNLAKYRGFGVGDD